MTISIDFEKLRSPLFKDKDEENVDEYTKKVAGIILGTFKKSNSEVDHVLDQRWIETRLKPNLNPKERNSVNSAIDFLKDTKGYIKTEERSGMFCLVLTQAGFDHIY